MMHTPAMFLFPLSGFLIISACVLLSVWIFKYTEKKTQLKWIIFLLILAILAGTTGTLLRIKAMKEMEDMMKFSVGQVKELKGINTPMERKFHGKKMVGSGAMIREY